MTLVTYVPAPGYNSSETGRVNAGNGIIFDVGAALTNGGGQFTVDDQTQSSLVGVLDHYPGVIRSGVTPGPVVNSDIISPVLAHSLRSDGTPAQSSDVLTKTNDGTYRPQVPGAAGGGGSFWSVPSPLGSSKRDTVDILMSTYDTNPASTDHTTAFQTALSAAAAMITNGASKVRIILDSRQKYSIGGAVTAGANGQWAQIPLPFSQAASGTIQLVGQPRSNDYSYISIANSGTVIESTLSAAPSFVASRGIASIFGGPASFSTGTRGINAFSAIKFATQDITIRAQTNPVITGIDCGWVHGFGFDGLLQFDTDQMAAFPGGFAFDFTQITPCTHPQAIPLITPFPLCWNGTLGDTLVVAGWLSGPVIGEVVHIRRMFAFALAGCVLSMDNSKQASRIDYLVDWDNAYGIAQMTGQSTTPQGPAVAPAPGSNYTGTISAPLDIGTWQGQTDTGVPAALARVYDVMDTAAAAVLRVEATWMFTVAGGTILAAPVIFGSGSSLTGFANGCRIRAKQQVANRQAPGVPVSGVATRNPFGREALVIITGGTVTGVAVNSPTNTLTGPGTVVVPANGIITLTYSVAPTWVWQVL